MSRSLEPLLDAAELFPDAYVLEVSSPGVPNVLENDRDFISFKGFPVSVTATTAVSGQKAWHGNLVGRDAMAVTLSLKGRMVKIPRNVIAQVQLAEGHSE
jgi:ribosome maturation factor RimP